MLKKISRLSKISYVFLGISVVLLAVAFFGDLAFVITSTNEACLTVKPIPDACDALVNKRPSIWLIAAGQSAFVGIICLAIGGRPRKTEVAQES